jgi:RsiW-degrading membrane proteinase PrsW (M82 family)
MLRWLLPSVLPALLALVVVWRSDSEREPIWMVLGTYAAGAVFGAASFFIEAKAAAFTGLDVQTNVAGQVGALLFLFALVAPMREAMKVAACWGAFRSKYFDEPYDGVVYASSAALGFASLDNAFILRAHPDGYVWIARTLLALPAHVFFACLWGWALGRAKQLRTPNAYFPVLFVVAVLGHGLYTHFVYGRGPGAMLVAAPLLLAMGAITYFVGRDLIKAKSEADPDDPRFGARISRMARGSLEFALSKPPTLKSFRDALRKRERPLMIRWVLIGTFVTFGAMIVGITTSVVLGHAAHVDFAVVDEHDVSTTAPVALLGAGLLAAFPLSGYLVARAAAVSTIAEPAAASALAIVVTLVLLGFVAPVVLVFALALAPIAFGLACAGAYVGRTIAS